MAEPRSVALALMVPVQLSFWYSDEPCRRDPLALTREA